MNIRAREIKRNKEDELGGDAEVEVRGEGGRVPEVMEIEGREKKARVKREEGENSSNMGSVVTD